MQPLMLLLPLALGLGFGWWRGRSGRSAALWMLPALILLVAAGLLGHFFFRLPDGQDNAGLVVVAVGTVALLAATAAGLATAIGWLVGRRTRR